MSDEMLVKCVWPFDWPWPSWACLFAGTGSVYLADIYQLDILAGVLAASTGIGTWLGGVCFELQKTDEDPKAQSEPDRFSYNARQPAWLRFSLTTTAIACLGLLVRVQVFEGAQLEISRGVGGLTAGVGSWIITSLDRISVYIHVKYGAQYRWSMVGWVAYLMTAPVIVWVGVVDDTWLQEAAVGLYLLFGVFLSTWQGVDSGGD